VIVLKGMVNPYLQVQRLAEEVRSSTLLQLESKNSKDREGLSTRAAQPLIGYNATGNKVEDSLITFGRWFLFCQRCRHGGHSNCITSWFDYQKKREVSCAFLLYIYMNLTSKLI
jgi:hypothetical protein